MGLDHTKLLEIPRDTRLRDFKALLLKKLGELALCADLLRADQRPEVLMPLFFGSPVAEVRYLSTHKISSCCIKR